MHRTGLSVDSVKSTDLRHNVYCNVMERARHHSQQVLDRVDTGDRVVGSVRRRDVFRQSVNFRVAHLLLFNKRGDLLVQRLAKTRERHPGRWGSSVAAYVASGESYREAIERRTWEELGVQVEFVRLLGKTSMDEASGCKKFISVFSGCWDGAFAIDDSHISEVRFVPVKEVLRTRKEEPGRLTPTFLHVVDCYLAGP